MNKIYFTTELSIEADSITPALEDILELLSDITNYIHTIELKLGMIIAMPNKDILPNSGDWGDELPRYISETLQELLTEYSKYSIMRNTLKLYLNNKESTNIEL